MLHRMSGLLLLLSEMRVKPPYSDSYDRTMPQSLFEVHQFSNYYHFVFISFVSHRSRTMIHAASNVLVSEWCPAIASISSYLTCSAYEKTACDRRTFTQVRISSLMRQTFMRSMILFSLTSSRL